MDVLDALRQLKHQVAVAPQRYVPQYFRLGEKRYRYIRHSYNSTWLNERQVELPLAREILRRYRGQRILEVGNVTPYYFRRGHRHDVVDKYEPGPRVINHDILDFMAEEPYDLIISISTIEHIGWDSIAMTNDTRPNLEQRDSQKIPRVITHLRSLLASGGEIFLTVPLGYNMYLDRLLERGKIPFSEVYYLKHDGGNRWYEASWEEVRGMGYDHAHCRARAVVMGKII